MGNVIVNVERCKGCELCVEYCPRKVLAVSAEMNSRGYHPAEFTDPERCNGCAICALVCPDVALEVWR